MSIFRIISRSTGIKARCGLIALKNGTVKTPAFMPVGTNGTVKAIRSEDLESIGYNIVLSNAYHLYLRPGVELIEKKNEKEKEKRNKKGKQEFRRNINIGVPEFTNHLQTLQLFSWSIEIPAPRVPKNKNGEE